jgi:hypothetical protein
MSSLWRYCVVLLSLERKIWLTPSFPFRSWTWHFQLSKARGYSAKTDGFTSHFAGYRWLLRCPLFPVSQLLFCVELLFIVVVISLLDIVRSELEITILVPLPHFPMQSLFGITNSPPNPDNLPWTSLSSRLMQVDDVEVCINCDNGLVQGKLSSLVFVWVAQFPAILMSLGH